MTDEEAKEKIREHLHSISVLSNLLRVKRGKTVVVRQYGKYGAGTDFVFDGKRDLDVWLAEKD